jgi:hypothetical protein
VKHALPVKAEGTIDPMVAVEAAGRGMAVEVAGQAGVDGDRFKLPRDLSRKARASSRASSLRDNPTEKCSFI